MELRQLRYFVNAAEQLSFSDAAKLLNIAQSTLSQQVRQLEDELGVQLFERNSHAISLTEAGAELLPFARRTLHEADSCVARIHDLDQLLAGTLNIGVTYSFSPILTETLMEFMKKYPRVKLNIYYKPMVELMAMLEARAVDFVLAFRPSESMPVIESHMLFDNHLAVIVKESHPLAGLDSVSLADIGKFNLALPSKGLQARNAFDTYLAAHPAPLNIRIELNEVNILLELIKRGNLVTILAEATVYNQTGVKAIPLTPEANEMEGCVHMLKNCYRKHSAIEFIHMLRESNAVRARVRNWFR
ncbi:LysR substrate-binding domain-containing protein [Muribaculum sp.]|jgi:LysR family cyn operon transcriptional activator|uniref:LysR substrate-binding domain-containing protein n=1 Tax=Muribaculum sp. TaxID=1918611 RepID=UPI002579E7C8|nr:LysR substrate-binding domain-containing protein [Muribaculum sp.]